MATKTTTTKKTPDSAPAPVREVTPEEKALMAGIWENVQAGASVDAEQRGLAAKKRQFVLDALSMEGDKSAAAALVASACLRGKTDWVRATATLSEDEFKAARLSIDSQIEYFRRLTKELAERTWTSTRPKRQAVIEGKAVFEAANGIEPVKPTTKTTGGGSVTDEGGEETNGGKDAKVGELPITNCRMVMNALVVQHGLEAVAYEVLKSAGLSDTNADKAKSLVLNPKLINELIKLNDKYSGAAKKDKAVH